MEDFIVVSKLTKKYGEFIAIDSLSFSVKQGEIFGFLGQNGAGKSTTLNILSTLNGFDSGSVVVKGHDIKREERKIKALIGVVPQEVALYSDLTAFENVSFFASLYDLSGKELKDAVNDALKFVGLSKYYNVKASKMSGGMKRRLNIACGIAHKPELVIMDEPTVGVDAQSRELIMESISSLRDKGATIIYTSHYMPEVQEICDRIAIIDKGSLVAIGTEVELLEVITDIKSIFIDIEVPINYDLSKLINMIRVIPEVKKVKFNSENKQIKIDVSLSFTVITPILNILYQEKISVYQINTEKPDLETTFLALTGKKLS